MRATCTEVFRVAGNCPHFLQHTGKSFLCHCRPGGGPCPAWRSWCPHKVLSEPSAGAEPPTAAAHRGLSSELHNCRWREHRPAGCVGGVGSSLSFSLPPLPTFLHPPTHCGYLWSIFAQSPSPRGRGSPAQCTPVSGHCLYRAEPWNPSSEMLQAYGNETLEPQASSYC